MSLIDILEVLNLLLILFALAWALSRSWALPVSVILIILGIGVAQLDSFERLVPIAQQGWFAQIVLFLILPTIIFNAALKLDVRQLQLTLIPLMLLTLGSLIITVTLMGLGLRLMQLDLAFALLLGAILTATDISGVLALYQRFSVSKRLTLLLEGESLFNNVAAIVATKLLFSIVLVGHFPLFTLWKEAQIFLWELTGGFVVGWLMALVLGFLLKYYRKEAFIEISLTLVLVYGSFLLAEYTLQVSGIMATVAAGITMTTWGRQTLSSPVAAYLTQFWDYLSRLSQALIFFLAGFSVNTTLLASTLGIIAAVIGLLWCARAVILYGLLPLIQRLPYQKPMPWRYRTLLYWGSLRGAIVLALVFSLGEFDQAATLLAVVTAVVMFTAVVQGLTLMPLAQRLGLSQEKLIEQLSRAEGSLTAQHRALERIPEFQQGGLFSARIADQQYQRCEHNIQSTQQQLALLRRQTDPDHQQRLLFIKVFALEKALYQQMFVKGHLSEPAYHNLVYSIELQIEAMRYEGQLPRFTLHFRGRYWLWQLFLRLLVLLPRGRRWADYLRALRTARDYEEAWGRYQGNIHVLERLDELAETEAVRPQIVEKIRSYYRHWHDAARARIDNTTERFVGFVTTMQEQLAERLILHAERETIAEQAQSGFLPPGLAQTMLQELDAKIREQNMTTHAIAHLHLDPVHLLNKVPFFRYTASEHCCQMAAAALKARTIPARQVIVKQYDSQDSLFLIIHGVIRVSKHDNDVATLMAGDFFGEDSLLPQGSLYVATYRTITPCSLYELSRQQFEQLCGL